AESPSSQRFSGIFNHKKIVAPRYINDAVDPGRKSISVHGDNRSCFLRNRTLYAIRINIPGFIRVERTRDRPASQNCKYRGNHGKMRDDDLVMPFEIENPEG